tara:strand:- start:735 stop:869 length:135 start_codon:yes stop_codon:yes gene_type:complete
MTIRQQTSLAYQQKDNTEQDSPLNGHVWNGTLPENVDTAEYATD